MYDQSTEFRTRINQLKYFYESLLQEYLEDPYRVAAIARSRLAYVTMETYYYSYQSMLVGNESAPIQQAQCRFPGLFTFNAKI